MLVGNSIWKRQNIYVSIRKTSSIGDWRLCGLSSLHQVISAAERAAQLNIEEGCAQRAVGCSIHAPYKIGMQY